MRTPRLAAPLLLAAACAGPAAPAAPDLAPAVTSRVVAIDFQARVGTAALTCGDAYTGVGTGREHVHAGDLRLYVHNVRLVTAAGAELPVSLTADGTWQSGTVALVDFTSDEGECTGDAGTSTTVKGTFEDAGAPISGLRFAVGVPFAENHQDATAAKAPLNVSALFWSWNSGYKFAVIEGTNHTGKQYVFHLGSTGCTKDANNTVTGCSAPNRMEVDLPGYALEGKRVVVDLKEVLTGVNLDSEVACHSSAAQGDCAPLFRNMGLPLGGAQAGASKVFRVE